MSPPKQLYIAVIGLGGVGKHFLSQLSTLTSQLSLSQSKVHLSVVLLARSSKVLLSPSYKPLQLSSWEDALSASTTPPLPPSELADYLSNAPEKVILVDNTSNQDLADNYPLFLNKGISIVTPNKKAFSSSIQLWRAIFAAASNGTGPPSSGLVFHESTVGAGLPVLSTLHDLLDTGDRVRRIEGVFSGTMSFLFNAFQPLAGGGGGAFSAEVRRAKELGYTEPDPRDDLNGLDVARKLTILARLVGLEVESATSFPVQSLIPRELEGVSSGEEFLEKLPQFDGQMETLRKEAEAEGKVVRFVGSIDVQKKEVKVGLEKFDKSHPIAALKGSDNIISFYTERYGDNPLIIQGAGAGGAVTAMGVTADLLKVIRLQH